MRNISGHLNGFFFERFSYFWLVFVNWRTHEFFSYFIAQVLKSINFTVEENQTVALLGDKGSGKSALIKLLQRIHDPQTGKVGLWVSKDGHNSLFKKPSFCLCAIDLKALIWRFSRWISRSVRVLAWHICLKYTGDVVRLKMFGIGVRHSRF